MIKILLLVIMLSGCVSLLPDHPTNIVCMTKNSIPNGYQKCDLFSPNNFISSNRSARYAIIIIPCMTDSGLESYDDYCYVR
jgi:hypothetical protein